MNGEIFFNMFKEPHPIYGKSEFMLKRWRKQTIYYLSGSYTRTETPGPFMAYSHSYQYSGNPPTMSFYKPGNTYSTNSIYLYDYVVVSDTFFLNSVYTASAIDFTPAPSSSAVGNEWYHGPNTWLNSPDTIFNNYILRYNPLASSFRGHPVYGYDPGYNPISLPPPYNTMTPQQYVTWMKTPICRDDGTYFEIVRGYPRNHYIHKRGNFALERFTSYGLIGNTVTSASYRKGMQTAGTTIGLTGLSDGSDPVQTTQVTNIDLIKSDNVIYH